MIGSEQVRNLLAGEGYRVLQHNDLTNNKIEKPQDCLEFRLLEIPDAVIVTHDIQFTFFAGYYASACIQEGAKLISANYDDFFIMGKD